MGGYQAAAVFRRCAAEGAKFGGWVFYGGRQLAEGTSPALRATSPFQGEAKRGLWKTCWGMWKMRVGRTILQKAAAGNGKNGRKKRAGDKDTLQIWMADQRLGRKFGRCVKIVAKLG